MSQGPEYAVHVEETKRGWEVSIVDPSGETSLRRPCADEAEARTFASTVRQHIYWLSPSTFREYYRLDGE
ncbi:MAG TPA: hypothetical protein VGH10_08230 [Actinomycetota bacterium]